MDCKCKQCFKHEYCWLCNYGKCEECKEPQYFGCLLFDKELK